jgi:hypothetical protein
MRWLRQRKGVGKNIGSLTHPPSPSLLCREGVTGLDSLECGNGCGGQGAEKVSVNENVSSHSTSPSLQSREGVASRSEVGGESANG